MMCSPCKPHCALCFPVREGTRQVGTRKPWRDGTALMKLPACGCETEMKRMASRREQAWCWILSLSQALWWITDEYLR